MVQDVGAAPACPRGMSPYAKKPITLPPMKMKFLQSTRMVLDSTDEEADE